MAEDKTCEQCQKAFIVADEDLTFYRKVSPVFARKTFEIPAPTLCPDCRSRRRMSWRNERNLYKRKCDLCQSKVVSIYSPDKKFKIYCQKCFWSDKWDGLSYELDFDFSKSFFDQYAKLQAVVPRINLLSKNSENSDFTNHAGDNKDCYLSFIAFNNENVMYSRKVFSSRDIVDCYFAIDKSEKLYGCFWVFNCYNSTYLINCSTVSDSNFCVDLKNCHHCFLSNNLRGKEYYFKNKPLSKEEYLAKVSGLMDGSYSKLESLKKEFEEVRRSAIYKYLQIQNSEDSYGDYIDRCKNCYMCFLSSDAENMRYCLEFDRSGRNIGCRDCMDCFGFGGSDLLYEVHSQAYGYHNIATNFSYDIKESLYLDNCHNCQNCFGCIGLKRKEYCVFNKQYTKEEYETFVPKIIEHMKKTGEWGEFFPMSLSPYGYNETVANDYYPLTKDEALSHGLKWQDNDYSLKYDGPFYEPKDNIGEYANSEGAREELLSGVLKCEKTGKPFRITPNELAFYINNLIPIPHRHYEVRFKEKFGLINPFKFFRRQCMCEEQEHGHPSFAEATEGKRGRCPVEFETTYAPDRPEKVYCESCYQKSII